MSIPAPQAFGVCAFPAVVCELFSSAPGFVTVITGVLASAWYGVQLYNALKKKDKDSDNQSPPR